jgi:hypothetical protein
MALNYLFNPHTELSVHYKYRVLMEHLTLDEARLIAQTCRHYQQPYTAAMQVLQMQYRQPHQLAQSEIAAILNAHDIRGGDSKVFQSFALKVDLLVSMLKSLEGPQGIELSYTSHVGVYSANSQGTTGTSLWSTYRHGAGCRQEVWGCFAGDPVSDLFRIQGTFNQHGYHSILQRYTIPSGLHLMNLVEGTQCAKLSSRQRVATLKNIKYILICLTRFWLLHVPICVIS